MDAGKAIGRLEDAILRAINESHLHPAVCRLVMLNVVNALLNKEREIADQEARAKPEKDGGADG